MTSLPRECRDHARRAGSRYAPPTQPELFEPVHEGRRPDRLQHGMAERVYAEAWRAENQDRVGGSTILEHIISPKNRMDVATQRDAWVAASFAQWLGTNCGQSFIYRCEREIDNLNALKLETAVRGCSAPADAIELAEKIGKAYLGHLSDYEYRSFLSSIAGALQMYHQQQVAKQYHVGEPGAHRAIVLVDE